METNSSSDGEDEVFFGPILAKEVKKASKLRRATQVFLPNFRENLNTSSDSSQCEDEGTAASMSVECEDEGTAASMSVECEDEGTAASMSVECEDEGTAAFMSVECEDEGTAASMSVEVVEATGPATNSDYLTEASRVTEAGIEQLTQSQTKTIHNGENVTKQEIKSLAHQQLVNNLKEAVPSCPTTSSPFPKIIELTKNEKNDSEQEESPFQKKSKALLDLIHRAREDLSSPTHSPSNVSLSESGCSSAMKRKNISSYIHESTSPVLKKITRTSLDTDAVQIPKGGVCNHETKAKFPSAPKVSEENVSHCLEGSSLDVQTLKSEANDGCLKDLCKEFTAVDRPDDDGQIRSDLNAGEEQKADEIRQCVNLDTVKVSEKQKLNSFQGMINDRHQTKDCLLPTLASAFSRIEHKPSSDSSVNKSLTNHLDLGGHGMFRTVGDVDIQLDPFLSKQHPKFENKENLVDKHDQPDYETVSQDKQGNHGEQHDGNIPKKTSPAIQAFHYCSNSMVGHCGRHGDLLVNGTYINPEHTMSGNYSQDAVIPGTIMNMAKPLYADSQMSLRRKVLEEKKAQLMKLKQAKESLKYQLLQDEHKQVLLGSVPSFEIRRPAVAADDETEASPTRTLDEARIDELTRYYTWKNSQLQDNAPLDSQCSIKQQEKPHLRWTDNLIVEVTELSSPREPSQRGKSILSKRL